MKSLGHARTKEQRWTKSIRLRCIVQHCNKTHKATLNLSKFKTHKPTFRHIAKTTKRGVFTSQWQWMCFLSANCIFQTKGNEKNHGFFFVLVSL